MTTYSKSFTDDLVGWPVTYHTLKPDLVEISTDGLHMQDADPDSAGHIILGAPYPHKNQPFTARMLIKFSVSDLTKACGIGFLVGDKDNGHYALLAKLRNDGHLLVQEYELDVGSTDIATSSSGASIANDTWYGLKVSVEPTGTGIRVSIYLYDESFTNLLVSLENVEVDGYEPVAGVHITSGRGQTGDYYVKDFEITYDGEPNLPYKLEPVLCPDHSQFDWIGAPMLVWHQHSDGKFYPYAEDGAVEVCIRVHGEASDTGDEAWLYRITGDPRDKANWSKVGVVFRRADLGWSRFEEFNLIKYNDGRWIAFVGGGTTWQIHRLRSTDEGATWEDLGVLFDGKMNHIYVEEDGTIIMIWQPLGENYLQISRSTDGGATWENISQISGWSNGCIHKIRGKYVLYTSKVYETDDKYFRHHSGARWESTDLVNWEQVEADMFMPQLHRTIYHNGFYYCDWLPWDGKLWLAGEASVIDLDPTETNLNDQEQRHTCVAHDPIYEAKKPTSLTLEVIPL